MTSHQATFQVDLRGLVDLLSHHLYSSPRVFLREVLQNGTDAITARAALDRHAPTRITVRIADGALSVTDTGIGLSADDVAEFLATIGRSSKRTGVAGIEVARREFLGQFGIGLLACFLVADEIEVVSLHASLEHAPIRWSGRADGSYEVTVLPAGSVTEPGTTVTLHPRPGSESWFEADRVREVATSFGELLPHRIDIVDAIGTRTINAPAPWGGDPEDLADFAASKLGFTPLDTFEVSVPLAGIRGVAAVLPREAWGPHGGHRVYLKGMLLGEGLPGLLPDWAFFIRLVVEAESLRPTAAREGLYEDELLSAVREDLGRQVRDWLTLMASTDPDRLQRFLSVHARGVKAMATVDDELADLMLPWLVFETSDGLVDLDTFVRRHHQVFLAPTVADFRNVAAVASAQGLGVVNGGYTYDTELVLALPNLRPGVTVDALDAEAVLGALGPAPAEAEVRHAAFLAAARARLDRHDADLLLRSFAPASVPALYLDPPRRRTGARPDRVGER